MSSSDSLLKLAQTVEATTLAVAIAESSWVFPILETVHVIGISMMLGTIVIVDLRLLNVASRWRGVQRMSQEILPYTWVGFAGAVITGTLMFISRATTYYENTPFRFKMLMLALAGANMLAFHFWSSRTVEQWGDASRTPRAAKVAGALSLTLWVCVVLLGRWIAFVD